MSKVHFARLGEVLSDMLLARKKINRIARWFAIVMAILFALGTVFLGVGSGTGNIFSGCSKSTPGSISASSSAEEQERFYKDQIEQNPQDTDSMLALASLYASNENPRYDDAIIYYKKALEAAPNDVDTLMLLGRVYMSKGDGVAAVNTYTQVTQLAPTNTFAFLQLGLAAKSVGQNQTAILAWSKWLEMNPNDSNAPAIRDEIAKLSTQPAVVPQTSTIPGTSGTASPVLPAP